MSPDDRRMLWRLGTAAAVLWPFVVTSPLAHRTATSAVAAVLVGASLVVTVGWLRTLTFFQPAAVGLSAWGTAQLMAGGRPVIVALVAAVAAGAAVGYASLVLAGSRPRHLLPFTSLAVTAFVALVFLPRATARPFPRPVLLGMDLAGERALYFAALVAVLALLALVRTLMRSDLGRRLAAVGAGERFASLSGIDVRATWTEGVALAGGLAGAAGWLLAVQARALPDPATYSLAAAVIVLTYPLVGGSTSLLGTGAVAVALTIVPTFSAWSVADEAVLAGALLAVAAAVRPDGLAGLAHRRRVGH